MKVYLRKYAPSEDSDQPAHSRSLIRIFTGRILDSPGCKGCKVSSHEQLRLRSDCADAQADLSLRWAHISEGTFSHVFKGFLEVLCPFVLYACDINYY